LRSLTLVIHIVEIIVKLVIVFTLELPATLTIELDVELVIVYAHIISCTGNDHNSAHHRFRSTLVQRLQPQQTSRSCSTYSLAPPFAAGLLFSAANRAKSKLSRISMRSRTSCVASARQHTGNETRARACV
jgi:hypothetical protein